MKKIILSLLVIGFFAIPMFGLAVAPRPIPDLSKGDVTNLVENTITNYLFFILLIISIIIIVYAGILFVFSAGDPGKTATARNLLLYAIIGIIVAFLARGLVNLVLETIE